MVLIMTDENLVSPDIWKDKVHKLYYAYQPIVNIHTGATLGFEALLRGWEEAGFNDIGDVFNRAYEETVLYSLDLHLRELAVNGLYKKPGFADLKLFYNLDNRVLEMPDYLPGNTNRLLKQNMLFSTNICFEISEKHEFSSYRNTRKVLQDYKKQNFRIAIDDFGAGYSGLTLLYHSEADYIKIDRFFIENINEDSRKKFFVSNVVNMAHLMGITVIAEGIETPEEFFVCREIGCDYAQGYLIQKPSSNPENLKLRYSLIEELTNRHRRYIKGDMDRIILELFSINTDIESVIITEDGKYRGVLDSSAILRILSEKQISIAQDQNPLTKLPGNQSINKYLSEIIRHHEKREKICVYFDFDNFKPFNDTYGFRQGDRIIRLFSDILKEQSEISREFVGHLGGDDFFLGYSTGEYSVENFIREIRMIIDRFGQDVVPFYNESDKKKGFLVAKNRSGRTVKFPFLSVSAAVLCLKNVPDTCTTEYIAETIAKLKKKAKKSADHMAISSIGPDLVSEKEMCGGHT